MSVSYGSLVRILSKRPRDTEELKHVEFWFKKKSKLLASISEETLLDVIQHCEFVTRHENDCIIHQGEKGHRFYIILRGKVAIMHKDSLEDVDLGDEGEPRQVDLSTLGNKLVSLGEGATFGEIALINPDCIRTASVVAEEKTDLVVIHRELYNRSVSKVIARDHAEKMKVIDSIPIFADWPLKWKKHLAVSFNKQTYSFESHLFKQGDPAEDMFFIVSGEVKLQVDPESHREQFEKYLDQYANATDDDISDSTHQHESVYFPVKHLPQIQKFSRVNRNLASRGGTREQEDGISHIPQSWSPSAIRKMNAEISHKKIQLSLCYLGEKQIAGDVEFLLGLDIYHCTAVCSQETVVMALHKPHFERLFRRRNPKTIKPMAQTLELQLTRRLVKPNILECAPLLKCFIYKLRQLIGDKKISKSDSDKQHFELVDMSFEQPHGASGGTSPLIRSRTYSWSKATKGLDRHNSNVNNNKISPRTFNSGSVLLSNDFSDTSSVGQRSLDSNMKKPLPGLKKSKQRSRHESQNGDADQHPGPRSKSVGQSLSTMPFYSMKNRLGIPSYGHTISDTQEPYYVTYQPAKLSQSYSKRPLGKA